VTGCLPLETDGLGIDVLVTGSHERLDGPSRHRHGRGRRRGIRPRSDGQRARASTSISEREQTGAGEEADSHATPAISVMFALQEGLAMLREEGIDNVWAATPASAG